MIVQKGGQVTKPIIVVKVPCKLLYVIQVKEFLIKMFNFLALGGQVTKPIIVVKVPCKLLYVCHSSERILNKNIQLLGLT